LTNYHVVKNADSINVKLKDGREFTGDVVGSDPRSDLALLKIKATGLPTLTMADSSKLEPGQWVVAIGSPFGFDYSVTSGIISAIGRPLPDDNYVPFIQTDVPINPGNSGGPLLNMQGEVVGINSQIFSRTGGFMGLSFAIPSNTVMDVVKQLKKDGHVTRGWLGVAVQGVTTDLAKAYGLNKPEGAFVAQVTKDGPAEKAGFKVQDIILSFDGKTVKRSSDLPHLVGQTKVGSTVPMVVWRDGKRVTLQVKIGLLPSEEGAAGLAGSSENPLGVSVTNLTAKQKSESEVKSGVLVTNTFSGSLFAKNDIILRIDGKPINTVKDFRAANQSLKKSKEKTVNVLVVRQGHFVVLRIKLND
jgi:serine protease Do